MSTPLGPPLEQFLYDALDSELGICVESRDAKSLRQRLYAIKKEREDFANLSLHLSRTKPATELWIVNRKGEENGK